MNELKLNVVRFENEDVIATSAEYYTLSGLDGNPSTAIKLTDPNGNDVSTTYLRFGYEFDVNYTLLGASYMGDDFNGPNGPDTSTDNYNNHFGRFSVNPNGQYTYDAANQKFTKVQ